ncbi:MAG: WecB/TagA/CpsF family glycosyltransferase [Muribaculaceae bacterium]|nr:WecB/TagA/CpsF family glycosyltransferase [Muribaculaceae bacterium]
MRKNSALYSELDGLFVDGMTMCWWLRILWGKRIPRLSFDMAGMAVDLFERLNSEASEENVYFIGAKQEELEASIRQFRKAYPLMRISGYRNGYFADNEERSRVIEDILKRNPTFVIVGMGSPLQERFVVDLRKAGYRGVAFTCGGFLHQTSRRINYYPQWVDKMNLRAFYRLTHEKGMVKRLWKVLVAFPVQFACDSILNK